jgi:hypothetical protein
VVKKLYNRNYVIRASLVKPLMDAPCILAYG